MKIKWFAGSGLLLAAVLLFAVNIFSAMAFRSARLDLTEGGIHTLSDGTRNILAALEEPVTLRLFLSRKQAALLPGISAYTTRVRELLEEYRRLGKGLVRVHVIEPEPFSEEEDRAMDYGLAAIPLNDEGGSFYFGLVGSGPTDTRILIPFFAPDRETFLEYDLTSLIYQVTHPDKKVIGLVSSLPMDGEEPQTPPWAILDQMHRRFEVRRLATDAKEIPPEVDVLMLVHPKKLPEDTLYAIDQFVLGGGRALVFVDPLAESDPEGHTMARGLSGPDSASSSLEPLFTAWGVGFSPTRVIGDIRLAEQVRFETDTGPTTITYPIWFRLSDTEMDGNDTITAHLDSILLASPGGLRKLDDGKTRFLPLLETTANATAFEAVRIAMLANPQDLLENYQRQGERYVLAARITGQVASAFPDRAPAGGDGTGLRKHLPVSEQDINVVVISDTDILRDRFWVDIQSVMGARVAQPTAGNGVFVVNAIENMSGNNDLIGIRNRGHPQRPFTRVDTIREEAEIRFQNKENRLLEKLREAEHNLARLERGGQGDGALTLGEAQQQEIERFRREKLRMRKELREVRHELRKNIERMENRLKFINIGLMPLLIGIGGIVIAGYRVKRRRKTDNRRQGGPDRMMSAKNATAKQRGPDRW